MNTSGMLQVIVLAALGGSLGFLAAVALGTVVIAVRAGGRREEAFNDDGALASRFTLPVSVVIPLGGHPELASRAIADALAFDYPEFEVIVVAQTLAHADLLRLRAEWHLEPREFFYRQVLPTSEVRRIYRSANNARLMLVDTLAGGVAQRLNCGVNLAQYAYVVAIDPTVAFEPSALMLAVAPALRDTANIVAVATHVERAASREARSMHGWSGRFQRLASARALMESRFGWDTVRAGVDPQSLVVAWRREAVVQAHGFAADAVDPVLEMLHRLRAAHPHGSIVKQAQLFGRVQPRTPGAAIRSAAHEEQAVLATLLAQRVRRERGAATTLRRLVAADLAVPYAQAWAVAAALLCGAVGWMPWTAVMMALLLLSFCRALSSNAALLVRGSLPGAPDAHDLRRLILAGPLELLIHGVPLALGRVAGLLTFRRPSTPASGTP
jgi:hypothetical protein